MFENMLRSFLFLIFCCGFCITYMPLPASAQSPASQKAICEPKIEAQVRLAFALFWLDKESGFRSQTSQAVCSGTNGAVPMPSQEAVNSLLGFAPGAKDSRATECYNCFGHLFIAKSLELGVEAEACLANDDCRKDVCRDQAAQNQANQAVQGNSGPKDSSGQSLEDVYDINARDLMAIP